MPRTIPDNSVPAAAAASDALETRDMLLNVGPAHPAMHGIINIVGYCMAVEKLLGISVPERCHHIRVIVSEISRLTDHLTCVGASAMELGAFTVFLYMIKAREYLWELVESVTGARLTVSYCRVGGVKADLPEGFSEQCAKAFEETRRVLAESDALLTRNRIFV